MIRIITSSRYPVDKKRIHELLARTYVSYSIDQNLSVTVVFVGKTKMRQIASTYKHEDVALPVLAFPYSSHSDVGEPLLGEIFLCYPQIILLASERNKRLDPMIDELVIHGLKNLLK